MKNLRTFLPAIVSAAATVCFAQPNRVLSKIDTAQEVILAGHVHPLASAANDAGAVEGSFPLHYITLMLKPTAAQQSSLQQLLLDQQNPASASFHQWLTPEQYADRFGVSSSDAAQIAAWLEAQGFTVDPVSRSRTFITFGGTAAQVQASFGTAIHYYRVNGQSHYANATDPKIPAALAPLVAGFRGLHNFNPKSRLVKRPTASWTNPTYGALLGVPYALSPDDFATIYDIKPLYAAGINGTGQKIAIVGVTQISSSDISTFWSQFGITSAKLVQTLATPRDNPGVSQGDVDESSLDIEWASAVARDATIEFVYSGPNEGIWYSAQYAVDNDVAPVLSMSYGECEMYDLVDLPGNRQLALQANSEGITWLAAAGDNDAADCDDYGDVVAEGGLAVDQPGSIPEVTSMGGTSLASGSAYWNSTNAATDESAKGYIPETVWNETADNVAAGGGGILGGGGGASTYFPQPSWQTGIVPNDGWRHVPDLAFNASAYGVSYYIYCSQCSDSYRDVNYVGGTSAATPTMAGVVALLNQYLKTSGLGNINPALYRLSQTAPSAFHDITSGNNDVACAAGSPGCVNGQEGWSAGVGYDSASGLGSVDVTNLVQNWNTQVSTGSLVDPSIDQNPVYQGFSESCSSNTSTWNFQLTLAEEAGIATTLTGFTINGASYSSQIASIFGGSAIAARGSISGCLSLASVSVPVNETFGFSGVDANGTAWSTALTIPFRGPFVLTVAGASNAASGQQTFAPGMIMSLYGTALGTLSQAAETIPLPQYMAGFEATICPGNCQTASVGYSIYLYYVGPNQVNLQIPYELVPGSYDLNLGNPYANTDYFFTVQSEAPGIFTLGDGTNRVANGVSTTASVGQVTTVYITGDGKTTPTVADGYSPGVAGLTVTPKPRGAVSLTVGGIAASTTDPNWFVGIPSWSVGVTQINFKIPAGVPSGQQPVVVTVGGVVTPPAYITIQ